MRDQIVELIHQGASGKIAAVVTVGTATAPGWIRFVEGDAFSAGMMLMGCFATIALLLVNVQAIKNRSQQNRLDSALKRAQLKEMGLDPDNLS